MAQWQIFKGLTTSGAPIQIGDQYDDGRIEEPHEPGFTTELVAAEGKKRKGDSWAYMGRSTQVSPAMEPVLAGLIAPIVAEETARIAQGMVGDPDVPVDTIEAAAELVTTERGAEIAASARASVLADWGLRDAQ